MYIISAALVLIVILIIKYYNQLTISQNSVKESKARISRSVISAGMGNSGKA